MVNKVISLNKEAVGGAGPALEAREWLSVEQGGGN